MRPVKKREKEGEKEREKEREKEKKRLVTENILHELSPPEIS